MNTDIAIIGGGPAGMLAAGLCGKIGARALILEKNEHCGAKLRITGKGRCNLTNNCTPQEFMNNLVSNRRFMYSAISAFGPKETMAFFEDLGVPLKTERGGRVFPADDSSHTVTNALIAFADDYCHTLKATVLSIAKKDDLFEILTDAGETVIAKKVILATGGMSYPKTGSTGDGYRFAKGFGHTIVPPRASLIPLVCADKCCRDMMGLSLKNVTLSLYTDGILKPIYAELGEMLFTHFGVSGPLVLSASAHLGDEQVAKAGEVNALMKAGKIKLSIDLKPALTPEQLEARLLRDFAADANKDFRNFLRGLVPLKMIGTIIVRSRISPTQKVNAITKEERRALIEVLKNFTLTVTGTRPIDEAIVTAGGVSTAEIVPGTMESKLVPGLYFAGEVIDLDAYTGGFNLQIAFSTAHLAAKAAACSV